MALCQASAVARGSFLALYKTSSLWLTDSLVAACGLSFSKECGILVPRPGIEPVSPAVEVQSLKPLDFQGSSPLYLVLDNTDVLGVLRVPSGASENQGPWFIHCDTPWASPNGT